MSLTINITFSSGGSPYDPDTVVLEDEEFAYGVKDASEAVIVAAGTAMTKVSTGVYKYDVDYEGAVLPLAYVVKAMKDGDIVFFKGALDETSYDGRYTSLDRLRQKFGQEAIAEWSKLSGYETVAYTGSRIGEVIFDTEEMIDDFLRGGVYSVPFEAPIPRIIVDIATELCGCNLYEARGLEGFDPEVGVNNNKLSFMRKRALKRLALIKMGRVILSAESVNTFVPELVEDAGSPEISETTSE